MQKLYKNSFMLDTLSMFYQILYCRRFKQIVRISFEAGCIVMYIYNYTTIKYYVYDVISLDY